MNEFLDDSMVLPPGDFDHTTLLPIMQMAQAKIRKKLAEEAQKKKDRDEKKLG